MNNQRQCWFCKNTAMKFQPITNKKGEIISLHNICQSCNKNQTQHSLRKRKSTLNSQKPTKPTLKKNRLLKGYATGLVSLALTLTACNALAQIELPSSEIVYQAPQTAISTSTIEQKEVVSVKPTPEEFKAYFLEEATKAGVWVKKAEHMMRVESGGWNVYARGDQKILANGHGMCKNKKSPLYGKPANARGGAQITECWYPQISDEQADDYRFATKFMLDVILSGKEKCRMIYSTCDAFYNNL